jgi:hypothetical protein
VTGPLDREVEWLRTSGDSLPALLKANGGPWDVIQAYGPRTYISRQSGIYLLRPSLIEERVSNQRKRHSYVFRGRLWWPIGSTTTSTELWEREQRALDDAVDLLIARVRGLLHDHSHGGRFLQVAEDSTSGRITVAFDDPDQAHSSSNPAALKATITYSADDFDFTA